MYKETFGEYVESEQKSSLEEDEGIIDMNDKKQTVYKLQGEVHGLIIMINIFMKPLLEPLALMKVMAYPPFFMNIAPKNI